MNRLPLAKRVQVISALVEGCSVRSTCRMTGVAKGTVLRLLADVGKACSEYQDKALRNLRSETVQVDEIWSFCYAKQKNVPAGMQDQAGVGDVWTFVAIDADAKLVISWLAGRRDAACATEFLQDVAGRLRNHVQLTTDGHRMYLTAVPDAFYFSGKGVDFAQLVKIYGNEPKAETRYSPAVCLGTRTNPVLGNPDPARISTSYVERQNLTMRMGMRRFTRLTNGFSKKIENHVHALALFYMHYNFARVHQTLRATPAMAAGITQHAWSLEEIVGLAEASQSKAA